MKRITKFKCEIFVEGIDFVCPFCRELVVSGDTHRCDETVLAKKQAKAVAVKRG